MSPGARGEVTFSANGVDHTVLFTNRALVDAEQKIGKSILTVAQGLADGSTGLTETVYLLRVGLEAARKDARIIGLPPVSLNAAFDVMDAAGFGTVAVAVMEAVGAVLGYGTGEDEGEPDPNG